MVGDEQELVGIKLNLGETSISKFTFFKPIPIEWSVKHFITSTLFSRGEGLPSPVARILSLKAIEHFPKSV